MGTRKKTPDILGDLLSKKKKNEGTPKRKKLKEKTLGSSLEDGQEEKVSQRSEELKDVPQLRSIIPESPEKNQQTHFVCFKVEDRDYALPLQQVERALRMVALLPVPEAPVWVAGLMNLHSQVIPVLDVRKRFGKPPKDPHPDDRLLVVQNQGNTFAVMVDEVNDVLQVPISEMAAPSGSLARSRPLKGVIRHEEKMILVLDPEQLEPEEALPSEE